MKTKTKHWKKKEKNPQSKKTDMLGSVGFFRGKYPIAVESV